MISTYVNRGQQMLRRWLREPGRQRALALVARGLVGLCLSAAGLEQQCMPLVLGFVWACRGWDAVSAALGGLLGYWLFWGAAGLQAQLWTLVSLLGALVLGPRRISRELPLLIPAVGMLTVSAAGLAFQLWAGDMTSVPVYLLRVALGGATPWVFIRAREGQNPVARWLGWGMLSLGLGQIAPVSWLGLGYVAAGAVSVARSFPCVAAVGIALDLAAVTPVPMTAVTAGAFFLRFLPRCPRPLRAGAPALMGLVVMYACGRWDMAVLPGLVLGGFLGQFLPGAPASPPRRGETGVVQVRLEMAAGVLEQTRLLLTEVSRPPVDTDALVARGVERACAGCSFGKTCRDSRRLSQLSGCLLEKPLVTEQELPVQCRKSARLLGELQRSQEQLRTIRADRERQREYQRAVAQQYRFLSRYLQSLSDGLLDRTPETAAAYAPRVCVFGNRSREENGDLCLQFPGTENRYYILLCDGMGTGPEAVAEAARAGRLLRQLLRCGFPPEAALESLNSICALRDRAGAVTVDLAQLALDTGKTTVYKWGAPVSYLIGGQTLRKLGAVTPPPGLCAGEAVPDGISLVLRREQLLLMVSDGLPESLVLEVCRADPAKTPGELAGELLLSREGEDRDDATVVTVQLLPVKV